MEKCLTEARDRALQNMRNMLEIKRKIHEMITQIEKEAKAKANWNSVISRWWEDVKNVITPQKDQEISSLKDLNNISLFLKVDCTLSLSLL